MLSSNWSISIAVFVLCWSHWSHAIMWYPEWEPVYREMGDPLNPNQVENNVPPYFLQTFEESPFYLGSVFGKTYTFKTGNGTPLEKWKMAHISLFGTYTIKIPDMTSGFDSHGQLKQHDSRVVRTGHYVVGAQQDGQTPALGVRLIPVRDARSFAGNELLDSYLRDRMGIEASDPIFAITNYFEPQFHSGFPHEFVATERLNDGYSHTGAYVGGGRTHNAPWDYAGRTFGLKNGTYPLDIIGIKYDGAHRGDFNKNLFISLKLLNDVVPSVQFARNGPERDYYDGNNLKNIFDFYRAWLDHEWIRSDLDVYEGTGDPRPFFDIIMSDSRYDTYCTEHIAMVINVGLNLPHTEEGYVELFGHDHEQRHLGAARQYGNVQKGGEYFFRLAHQTWYTQILGGGLFPKVSNSRFKPLWKMPGQNQHPEDIPSLGIRAGDPIRRGELPHIKTVGFGLAWAPQTLPDMVADFFSVYGRFDIYAEAPAMSDGTPYSHALVSALLEGLFDELTDRIRFTTSGNVNQEKARFNQLVAPIMEKYFEYAGQVILGDYVHNRGLFEKFKADPVVRMEMARLRDVKLYNLSEVGLDLFYYTPPEVFGRIIRGNHSHNRYVNFEVFGTLVDERQLEELPIESPLRVPHAESRLARDHAGREGMFGPRVFAVSAGGQQ